MSFLHVPADGWTIWLIICILIYLEINVAQMLGSTPKMCSFFCITALFFTLLFPGSLDKLDVLDICKIDNLYILWLMDHHHWLTLNTCKIFEQKHKHTGMFLISIIPPEWHDTGCWNFSSCKRRAYLVYRANIMAADVLVMQGVRASAAMILT